MSASVRTVPTSPFEGQKPGTSGLRKRVVVFQQPKYTENFVQAIFTAMPAPGPKNATLVVGGDGRYFMKDVVQKIVRIGAANGISKFIIGQNGILSTPAASALIRQRSADGGIILTASHNPGGPKNDFGIKYNTRNGGPAPEAVTDAMYQATLTISEYREAELDDVDLATPGTQRLGSLEVEVVDSVQDYAELIGQIFDFGLIRQFRQANPGFKLVFDGLSGVTGPYGRRIFVDELGFPETSLEQCTPLEDFGGGHPDPNLTYADKLVKRVRSEEIDLGAASDGDGDRNMVLSHDWFVTPSDSVAVIAHYAQDCIPYFMHGSELKGLARSMPTSCAIDRVAKAKNLEAFEVPTGWKFFGNLMDAGRLSICGEESFGTGSDHIREKDGVWAIVAWLNIIAHVDQTRPGASVRSIMLDFYQTYGRNYFTRYDYEEVDSDGASKMMDRLRGLSSVVGTTFNGYTVEATDDFEYTDPIDNSVTKKQGVRIVFTDTSRIIFRLSGTGSQGATVRIYIERYDPERFELDTQEALKPLVSAALDISKLEEYTGRKVPTVIT
ncbi:hypothetical protein GGF46_003940 [Coemansia sp. RSA 552]|nr:hypothetical protein GGF46_003940 [Coemansia sp. RSA 552]